MFQYSYLFYFFSKDMWGTDAGMPTQAWGHTVCGRWVGRQGSGWNGMLLKDRAYGEVDLEMCGREDG